MRLRLRVLVLVAVTLGALTFASAGAQDPSDCEQADPQEYNAPEKVKADLNGQTFKLSVGRERSVEVSDELQIETNEGARLPANGTSLSGESVGSFEAVDGEGAGRIRANKIRVGVIQRGGNVLIVNVCVQPAGVKPGRYSGKVLVKGGEIDQFTIAGTATVQSSSWALWALVALLAGVSGFALRTIANLAQLAEKPPTPIGAAAKREKRDVRIKDVWPAYTNDVLLFGTGVIVTLVAVGAAYYATYVTNDTFGGTADAVKLLVAAFAAATGGTTAADLLAAIRYKGKDGGA